MPKTADEISLMRQGGRILATVLKQLIQQAGEGTALRELDERARHLIAEAGAQPAFFGYQPDGARRPYPAAICTSINEVVVHGLPTDYRLRGGDILKIDMGVLYGGFYTDAAVTVGIGALTPAATTLIACAKEALTAALSQCQAGKTLGDIGDAVSGVARARRCTIIRALTGHGIGRQLHEEPAVFNYGRPGQGMRLISGMTLAVEPMISAGSGRVIQRPDESYATDDGSLSAHVEHTVAITENGPEILTQVIG